MAYTSHGYHIPGTEFGLERPERVARCGGLRLCTRCASEVAATLAPNVEFPFEYHVPISFRRDFTNAELMSRFGWHKGVASTNQAHAVTRQKFIEFAQFLDETMPTGRAKSVAFTELETASMWCHKAIAELAPPVIKLERDTNGNNESESRGGSASTGT